MDALPAMSSVSKNEDIVENDINIPQNLKD